MKLHILIPCILFVVFCFPSSGNTFNQDDIYDKRINHGGVFIENKGQWDGEVRFLTKMGGMNAWITNQGVVFDFYRIEKEGDRIEEDFGRGTDPTFREPEKVRRYGHVVKMNFVFPHRSESTVQKSKPAFRSLDQKTAYHHYFLGNDPSRWARFVPLYGEVIVESAFGGTSASGGGIDIRYYYEPGGLRYDFIVHPEARVEDIAFTLEGTDGVWIDGNGDLVMLTILGEARHTGLKAYQEIGGERIEVPGRFHMRGDGGISFEVEREDDTQPLIIDPLISSTFLGGSDIDGGYSLALDSEGSVYVTGYTRSSNFPTTPGAYDETHNGEDYDVFVSALSSDLSELLYSTFLGGSSGDWVWSLALDSEGSVYVTGETSSSNFPTTPGAYDETHNGERDVFISALSSDLSELLYSTFLGGSDEDGGWSLALDSEGSVYVTGGTESSNFPTTPGAYDETHNGEDYDVFVSALSSDLSELLYSTFLGGGRDDFGYSLALDSEGSVYVTGGTQSAYFPTTPGAYYETYNGWGDVFVSALSSDLSELLYSTFLGGSGSDRGISLALDSEGSVYVTGRTRSDNFPTTPGAYDETHNGEDYDVFVSALSPDLSELLYSTFLGGSGYDVGRSLALDSEGSVYVTGGTQSAYFPTTLGAYDETNNGWADVFVSALSSDLSELLYSTFLGGRSYEYGFSLALDSEGSVYVTGWTRSLYFPTTPGAYDETYNGEGDVFISKFESLVVSVEENHGPPISGDWKVPTHFGEFVFTVNPDGTHITKLVVTWRDWRCGGVTRSGYQTSTPGAPGWSISNRNRQFTIVITTSILRNEKMTIKGKFETGKQAWGTWSEVVHGTTCSGNWGPVTLPDQLLLAYPGNGDIVEVPDDKIEVILGWNASQPLVNKYHLEIARDVNFTDVVFTNDEVTDTFYVFTDIEENQTYYWRGRAKNEVGWGQYSEVWSFKILIVGVEDRVELPEVYSIMQNYPNPFNPLTVIRYSLPVTGHVTLKIYNVLGTEVATLVNEEMMPGIYEVTWDASGMSSGVYIYRLQAGEYVESRKMLYLK